MVRSVSNELAKTIHGAVGDTMIVVAWVWCELGMVIRCCTSCGISKGNRNIKWS